jgi:hypothetical protein
VPRRCPTPRRTPRPPTGRRTTPAPGGRNQQQLERPGGIPINHPGPTGSATFASAFGGAWLPDTTWTLKIRDDVAGFAGSLAAWSVTFDFRIIVKPHDFDGGFFSDILWQNNDGTPGIWTMTGFASVTVGPAGPNAPWPYNPGPSWHARGDGDFNDDGKSDILWQNSDGTPGIWLMNGLTATAMSAVGTNPGPAWVIKDTGDFNFDGKADILWQNDDGTPGIWLMDGFNVLTAGSVGTNPGPGLADQGQRRLQQRRQVRHPVAEPRRHGGDLADGRPDRAQPGSGRDQSRSGLADQGHRRFQQ